jgi:hypothetical protein
MAGSSEISRKQERIENTLNWRSNNLFKGFTHFNCCCESKYLLPDVND